MDKLIIEKIDKELPSPRYALEGDGGLDCYSSQDVTLTPDGSPITIPLGIKVQLPEGHVALVLAKSGLSSKQGLNTVVGLIDNGYRGEVHMIAHNISDQEIKIEKGQKVCQLMVIKLPNLSVEYGNVDCETQRGDNGFGSTGI